MSDSDILVKTAVESVLEKFTAPVIKDITERLEFFAQSKLDEIESNCQCIKNKRLTAQLYRRIKDLEGLIEKQSTQLRNACERVDTLEQGTDILEINSCNNDAMQEAMLDMENDTYDGSFSLTNLFDEPLTKKRKISTKKYFSWEERVQELLTLESMEWHDDIIRISRSDANAMFPSENAGKSLFK